MFKLTKEEYRETLRSQNVILEKGKHSKYPPYAFTEHGVLMLSSILRSSCRVYAWYYGTLLKLIQRAPHIFLITSKSEWQIRED